ncbi:hypothetical protein [Caballeronia sp. LZ034LL]|uniref:hypothetical protein n=1 Tax=Caballeronia sp. LZ034LL TaxID=3038567 RepID=UPI002860DEC9|nr:hypothetical protein [Caballeronia sp. LZ034LL]MDR5833119.1 hypothetical protein [Caballeronia sp. LZ034LL]
MNRTEYSLSLDSVICLRCNTLSRADEDMCPQCGADRQGAIFTSAAETAPPAAMAEPAPEQLDIVDLRDTHWLKRAVRRKMVTSYPSVAEPGDEPRTSARKPARTGVAVLVGGVMAGLAAGGYWYVHSDDDANPTQGRPTLSAAGAIHSGNPVTDRAGDARQASLSRSRADAQTTPAPVTAASASQATAARPPAARKPETTQAVVQTGPAASAPTAVARVEQPASAVPPRAAVAHSEPAAAATVASAAGSSPREVVAAKPLPGASASASAPVAPATAAAKPSSDTTNAARPAPQQVAGANASTSTPVTPVIAAAKPSSDTTNAARPSPQQVAAAKPVPGPNASTSTPATPATAATKPPSDTTNTERPSPQQVAAAKPLPGANASASGPVTTAATATPKPAPAATLTARPAQPETQPHKPLAIAAQTPPAPPQPAKPVAPPPSPSIARNIIAVQQSLASRDLAAARKHLRTLDANQPRSPEIQQLAADLSRQERARDSAIATARTCAANKEPSCALRNARRAVSLDPRNGQAQASLRRALAVQNESNTEYFQQASGIPKPIAPAMTFDGRWSVGAHHSAAPIATDTHLTLFGWGVPTVSKGRGDAH